MTSEFKVAGGGTTPDYNQQQQQMIMPEPVAPESASGLDMTTIIVASITTFGVIAAALIAARFKKS